MFRSNHIREHAILGSVPCAGACWETWTCPCPCPCLCPCPCPCAHRGTARSRTCSPIWQDLPVGTQRRAPGVSRHLEDPFLRVDGGAAAGGGRQAHRKRQAVEQVAVTDVLSSSARRALSCGMHPHVACTLMWHAPSYGMLPGALPDTHISGSLIWQVLYHQTP
jgi:hypothetical protein